MSVGTSYEQSVTYRIARRLAGIEPPAVSLMELVETPALLGLSSTEFAFPPNLIDDEPLIATTRSAGLDPGSLSFEMPFVECVPLQEFPTINQLSASVLDVDIGQNLFSPLPRVTIEGKSYSTKGNADQLSLFGSSSTKQNDGSRMDGYRKSFREVRLDRNNLVRKSLDIWDLILPVLQPPVDLAFADILDLPPRCCPYPYQWQGIRFLVENRGALLADDMGTGKTVQSILAARLLFQRGTISSALVISPVTILRQWDREFEKWAPSLTATVVRGTPDHRRMCWAQEAHVWIVNYETLWRDIDWVKNLRNNSFGLIIVDEAQRIKNPCRASSAVKGMRADFRWALTGTPVENSIQELASLFSFLRPGLFPHQDVGAAAARELIKPYFLRRRKEDVLKDLPAKEEFPIWIRFGDRQQATYDKMERERIVRLRDRGSSITAQSILALILELKKICNRDPVSGESVKLDWIRENMEDILMGGDKALIWTQFRQAEFGGSDWLAQELHALGCANFSEASTDNQREAVLESFQEDPSVRVLVGNPRSAGVGLNELVAANYVVHLDHWWNPAVTNQATARSHRPGQTKQVFVYHLWVEGTIEEMILRRIEEKQKLYDFVIDSLSSEVPQQVLFEVFNDLLVKHGFRPMDFGSRQDAEGKKPLDYGSPRDFERL